MGKGRIILVVVAAVGALVVAGAMYFFWSMGGAMYAPGDARALPDLEPAKQDVTGDAGRFKMPGDIELAWFAKGDGRPVLMLHGGPGRPDPETWPAFEPLYDRLRAVHYAQRGCGESTRPFDTFAGQGVWDIMQTIEQKLGLAQHLGDIERIRRLLGEEKLIVVGHSFGGFIAAMYAAEFPEHVDAMVLVAPADMLQLPQPEGADLFSAVRARLPEEDQAAFDEWMKGYFDFSVLPDMDEKKLMEREAPFGKFYAQAIGGLPGIEDNSRTGGWMIPAMYLSTGARHDWRDIVGEVEAPVLVIHGEQDLQTEARSRTYVDAFSQAKFEVVEGAGHFPHLSHPTVFASLVEAFLDDKLPQRAPPPDGAP